MKDTEILHELQKQYKDKPIYSRPVFPVVVHIRFRCEEQDPHPRARAGAARRPRDPGVHLR